VGRPTKDEIEDRTERLVAIASSMFIENGYRATSLEAVATAAGVAKKTIYSQFGDKAALFRYVFNNLALRHAKLPQLPMEASFRDGLIRRATLIVESAFEPSSLAFNQLVVREGLNFPELQGAKSEITETSMMQPLSAFISNHIDEDRRADARFLCELFIGLLLGRYSEMVAHPAIAQERNWYSPKRIERICDFFIAGASASAL
jgi:TetR/AcrR family transcriptional regulator, mexJK operon transcriptional repressor